jgi:hypothetical protein
LVSRGLDENVHRDPLLISVSFVRVAGRRYVSSPASPALAAILRSEGLEPVEDLSEFERAGGSAFCLKTFVA